MTTSRTLARLVALAVTVAGSLASPLAPAHAGPGQSDLAAVRQATEPFHDLAVAQAQGFGLLRDQDGIACIDLPGSGAMGEHYVDVARVLSGRIAADAPQALIYEPMPDGSRRLVAVEYVVFAGDWIADHTSAPQLYGRTFDFTNSPNRFGLPPFFSLHAWVWQPNPSGEFFAWNPRVTCANA